MAGGAAISEHRPLRSLDLFSGLGGITHALRGVALPAAYCEIDRFAAAVLAARMADGSLPMAPLCSDVAALDGAWPGCRSVGSLRVAAGRPRWGPGESSSGARRGGVSIQGAHRTNMGEESEGIRHRGVQPDTVPGFQQAGKARGV